MSLTSIELLRHMVATIAYRAHKALRDAPAEFGAFEAGGGVRQPAEILAHMGDLMDWAVTMIVRGPFADSLTHVGQVAMLRRLAGGPVKGENYARAHITTGRVGRDQPPPVREF